MTIKEIQTIINKKIANFIFEYNANKKCIYSSEVYKKGKLKAGCKFNEHNFYEYKIYRKIDDIVLLFELDTSYANVNITKIFTSIAICGVIIDGKFYKLDIMRVLDSIYINEKQAEKLDISKDIFRKLIINYIKNLIIDFPDMVKYKFKKLSQKEYKYIFELYNDGYLTADEAYIIISLPNNFQITYFDKEVLEESTSEDIENIKHNKLMNFYDKYRSDKNYKFSGEIIKKEKEKQPANWLYGIYKNIDDIIVYYLFESNNTYIDSIKIGIIAIDVLIDGKYYPIGNVGMEDIYADEETAKKLGLSEKIFRELVSFGLKNQIEGGYMNTIKYINSKEKITPKQINYISKLYNLGYLTADEATSIISSDLDAYSRIKSIPDTDVLDESTEEADYEEFYKKHHKEIEKKHLKEIEKKINKFYRKYKASRAYDYLLSGEIYKIENESFDEFNVYRKIDDVILKYSFSDSIIWIDEIEVPVSEYGVILNNGELYRIYPHGVNIIDADEEIAKQIGVSEDIFRQIISNGLKEQIRTGRTYTRYNITKQQMKYLYKLCELGYLTSEEVMLISTNSVNKNSKTILDSSNIVLEESVESVNYKEIQGKLDRFSKKYNNDKNYKLSGKIYKKSKIENQNYRLIYQVYNKIDDMILLYTFDTQHVNVDSINTYVTISNIILENGKIYNILSDDGEVYNRDASKNLKSEFFHGKRVLLDEEEAEKIGLSKEDFRTFVSYGLKKQLIVHDIEYDNHLISDKQVNYLFKLCKLGYLTKEQVSSILSEIQYPKYTKERISSDEELLDEGYIQGKYIRDFAPIEKIKELEKELDIIIDNIKSQGLQYILDNCRVFKKAKLYNSEIAIGNFIFECYVNQSLKDSSNIKNNYITITYDRVIYDNGKYKAVYLDRRKEVYSGYFSISQCSKLGFTKNAYKRALAYNIVNYSIDTQCNYSLENQIFILQLYKEGYLDKNDIAYILDHLDVYTLNLEKKDEVIEERYWEVELKFPKELEEKVINETINLKDIKRIVKECKNEIDLFSENRTIISYKRDIESLVSAIELQLYWYSEEILLYTSIIYNDGETKTLTKVFNITIKDLLDMGLSYKKILYRLLNYYNTTEKDEDISRLIFTYYKNRLMTKDEYRTLMMLIINEMKDDIANIEYLE